MPKSPPLFDPARTAKAVAGGLSLVSGIALAYLAKGLMWRTPAAGPIGFALKGVLVLGACLLVYALIERALLNAWSRQ